MLMLCMLLPAVTAVVVAPCFRIFFPAPPPGKNINSGSATLLLTLWELLVFFICESRHFCVESWKLYHDLSTVGLKIIFKKLK